MTNTEKIIKLNTIWYHLIGPEHHKDRDCHFYITQKFSYGDTMKYIVEHNGYIKHDYEDSEWNTREEAEVELITLISNIIKDEMMWSINSNPDKDNSAFKEIENEVNNIVSGGNSYFDYTKDILYKD